MSETVWTEQAPDNDDLRRVSALAEEQARLEREVKEAEERLTYLEELLRRTREELLPEAMTACGMRDFTMLDGTKVTIGLRVDATITEERKPEAHAWMRENGHGDLIKHVIGVSLGMKEDALAPRIIEAVRAVAGSEVAIADKSAVHPQTLKAFARRELENGRKLPESIWAREVKVSKLTKEEK